MYPSADADAKAFDEFMGKIPGIESRIHKREELET